MGSKIVWWHVRGMQRAPYRTESVKIFATRSKYAAYFFSWLWRTLTHATTRMEVESWVEHFEVTN